MKIRSTLFLLLLMLSGAAMAQTTGSFNTNVTFMGQPRQLSVYVPATYNAAIKYRLMVCLHGLGDNSDNYRTALINSLSWGTNYVNTIIVCPEASATTADYYYPAGHEAIVQSSITYAMSNYHIDTSNVILQGFSLGGRAALRYGLDHPGVFKGLLLNTPAVQGVKEALNGTAYNFNYAAAQGLPPVFITHGETDVLYTGAIDTAYRMLLVNDAKVKLVRIPGMGHTIPSSAQMDFLTHFADPGNAPYDLDIVQLNVPQLSCSGSATPSVLIRNAGKNTLTSAKIHYVYGSTSGDYTWTGSLAKFQHATVTLPALALSNGTQNVTVSVAQLNGSLNDTFTANNTAVAPITYTSFAAALPMDEGFESTTFPPTGWFLNQSGEPYAEYYRDDVVMRSGAGSLGAFNTILFFDNSGRREELISPAIDLTSIATPKVSFDVAYNYHRYTPPYLTVDTTFTDSLEVLISTDCGATYQSLYKKGGKQLATFSSPILNPLQVNDCFADPADSNWRRESISLQPYGTNNRVLIKFRYISALGGSLNIDNVSFSNSAVGVSHVPFAGINVFPNPANSVVMIKSSTERVIQAELLDMSGKLVRSVNGGTEQIELNVADVPSAVYFLRLRTADGVKTDKITIRH